MELKQTVRTFTGKMYSLSVTDLKAQRHAWERDKQLEELHSGCYVEVYVLFSSFSPPIISTIKIEPLSILLSVNLSVRSWYTYRTALVL